ncbi:type IV pilus assembly protein FimV [Billgrantia endophytica]|uniref:FimV N-terminal domain-containing protein n=1 Tax=Billgrantia endophytica TaxID=2033802 RepID=A0A2N7U993_9GAMM|nr:FimV/HubP family polar landmark protein [Halomonas endophytica]PMR77004.1 hypothetical protein C1H69_04715 [Halomonas endophytica]
MRRKLTFTMMLSLSAVSLRLLALEVGEVDVRSPLDAPLRATLPLTDTVGMAPDLLRVSVASAREFEAAGLFRTPLAASVRLAVRERQGQLVVDIDSEKPIREPWMDLMLRFDWPNGHQLHAITLLLDPPDYDELPTLMGRALASRPALEAERSPPEPLPDVQPGDPAWVRSGDTLWTVAGRLLPDSGVSMDQMMVALVEANPDLFPSGNINGMRAGHVLVVPPRDLLTSRSAADAGRVVQAMNQAWANRGSGPPASVPLGTTTPPVEVAGAQMAAAETVEAPRTIPLSEAELAVEGPNDPAVPNDTSRLALLESRWVESQAALAAVQAERDALHGELDGLRGEVEAMRDQLAALIAGGRGKMHRGLMLGGAGLAALLGLWGLVRLRRHREISSTEAFATMPRVPCGTPPPPPTVPPAVAVDPVPPGLTVGEEPPWGDQASVLSDSGGEGADVLENRGVIDYQPPPLDTEPARREETPMQPGIDFPPGIGEPDTDAEEGVEPGTDRLPGTENVEWEVEEVVFPPLDRDNEGAPGNPVSVGDLDEARRLLEAGDTDRARALLRRLVDGSDDPGLRTKARNLLTSYRL